jgi:hypothetical protein
MNIMNINIDLIKNDWINEVPIHDREEIINNYLKLGYIVSTLTKTTINFDNTLFNPIINTLEDINRTNETKLKYVEENINNNMVGLRGSIDKIIHNTSNSSLKGKIGENLVGEIIQKNFPDDTLEFKGTASYESDFHLHLKNIGKILIEVKTYKETVSTSEIKKFKRDMTRSGLKAGIFISTTSGIVGKTRYELEKLNTDQIIIYIPNSSLEGSSIIWGILFTKKILELDINNITDIDSEEILKCYKDFEEIYSNICIFKNFILNIKNTIIQNIEEVYNKSLELEMKVKLNITNCEDRICKELSKYKENIESTNGDDQIDTILELMYETKDKRYKIYKIIHEYCKINKYIINIVNTDNLKWMIYNTQGKIGEIKYTKTKVSLKMNNYPINIDITNEKDIQIINKIIN